MLQILNLGKQTLKIKLVLNKRKKEKDSMDYWWNDLIFRLLCVCM